MPFPTCLRLSNCCGCFPLQKGCILIGCILLVGSVLEAFKYVFLLIANEIKHKACQEKKLHAELDLLKDFKVTNISRENSVGNSFLRLNGTCNEENVSLYRFLFGISLAMYVIYFILTALMITGAKMVDMKTYIWWDTCTSVVSKALGGVVDPSENRHGLMSPWLGWSLAQIIFSFMSFFGAFRSLPEETINNITLTFILIYFFLVVNSYYAELRQADLARNIAAAVAVACHDSDITVHPGPVMQVCPIPNKDDPPPPYPGPPSDIVLSDLNPPPYSPNPLYQQAVVQDEGSTSLRQAAPISGSQSSPEEHSPLVRNTTSAV